MILTSFKTNGEALQIPPTIIPTAWVTDAYSEIVTAIPFATVYMNTIISAVVTTAVQVAFCAMAAYAFARIEFPFKKHHFPDYSFSADGARTDLPDSAVFDCSEIGIARYLAGVDASKPV